MTAESLSNQLTEHDPGSGLYRRDVIFRKLEELFQLGFTNGPVVMLLEIHRFKQINDGTGPVIGDRVISSFAKRLQRATPDDAIIGRMGGDGFAILLPTDDSLETTVKQILEITRRPFSLGGNVLVLGLSIGIAIGKLHGGNAAKLVHAADVALHTILESQAQDYVIFSEEMMTNARSMHLLENDLRYSLVTEKPALLEAVASNQFEVFYQPQVSTVSNRPVGVEALIRWHHPERGYVSPEEFVPLAEDIGVINLLGTWVLKTACGDIENIRQSTPFKDLRLSVNVSPRQLEDVNLLAKQVDAALGESGFSAEHLVLEITENTVLQCDQYEIEKVLRKRCALALDDFGTGYSSMNVLRSLPVKVAKLDKVFVINLFREDNETQQKDEQMIRAFQHMCRALDIKTTVEGVETKEQAEFISELGCDLIQGFYYAKPMTAGELKKYLNQFGETTDERLAVSH